MSLIEDIPLIYVGVYVFVQQIRQELEQSPLEESGETVWHQEGAKRAIIDIADETLRSDN